MKKLFFLPSMALVLGLGLTLSMSSFKSGGTLIAPTSGWYLVSPSGAINPVGPVATPPASSPTECARSNSGDICAVELQFVDDPTTQFPANISTIPTTTGVTKTDDANLPE